MLDDHIVNPHKEQLGNTTLKESMLVNCLILAPKGYYNLRLKINSKKEIKYHYKLFL